MAEKVKVYKLKDDSTDTLNKVAECGFDLIDGTLIMFKIVPQPLDSEPVQALLDKYYNNIEWQQRFYKYHRKDFIKDFDLKYDNKGRIKDSKKFKQMLCAWRIEIDPKDDYWLGFRAMDPHISFAWYGAYYMDKYCLEEINKLKEVGVIEEIEVDA